MCLPTTLLTMGRCWLARAGVQVLRLDAAAIYWDTAPEQLVNLPPATIASKLEQIVRVESASAYTRVGHPADSWRAVPSRDRSMTRRRATTIATSSSRFRRSPRYYAALPPDAAFA